MVQINGSEDSKIKVFPALFHIDFQKKKTFYNKKIPRVNPEQYIFQNKCLSPELEVRHCPLLVKAGEVHHDSAQQSPTVTNSGVGDNC